MSKARQTCTVLLPVIDVKDRDSARHVFDLLGQQTIIFQDHKPVNGYRRDWRLLFSQSNKPIVTCSRCRRGLPSHLQLLV